MNCLSYNQTAAQVQAQYQALCFACSDDAQDPLPMQLLQKYIAYARQYCHPVLSDDAKQILKEHYCKLRQDSVANEGTPVTVSGACLLS